MYKVRATAKMLDLAIKPCIQILVSLINYLRSFVPNVAEITETLKQLVNNDVVRSERPSQQTALIKMKRQIANELLLQYFDNIKETTL